MTGSAYVQEKGRVYRDKDGGLVHEPAVKTATLVDPAGGRMDFTVGSTQNNVPGEKLAVPGTVTTNGLTIDNQYYPTDPHQSKHATAGPGNFTVLRPVEGTLKATMEEREIQQGKHGPEVVSTSADPRTGEVVAGHVSNVLERTGIQEIEDPFDPTKTMVVFA
ncbi:MAG: hypothetical protein NNA18_12055, partial [Nitrospira sp.]|nr:hypothetical protein [Nitrospira sp.]